MVTTRRASGAAAVAATASPVSPSASPVAVASAARETKSLEVFDLPAGTPPVGPHHHSWRWSPPLYTAISCCIWLVFFWQPYWLRVALWTRARALVEDERLFLVVGTLAVHSLVFITSNLCMAIIYYMQWPFMEQFKIQKDKPWPWQRGSEERAKYFTLIKKSIAMIAFNQYFLSPILLWFSYADQKRRGMTSDLSQLPHWYTSVWQITVFMIVEDTLFYWAHRALHHPLIYGHIHKIHHTYKVSIGIASEYAHPIEFIFSNVLPFTAGPLLLGTHYWTMWQWTILRIGETVDGHCGYECPWSPYRLLPFSGSATAHDYHHSHNVGNYASFFTWWDALCGTDGSFKRWEKKQLLAQVQIQPHSTPTHGGESEAAPTAESASSRKKKAQ